MFMQCCGCQRVRRGIQISVRHISVRVVVAAVMAKWSSKGFGWNFMMKKSNAVRSSSGHNKCSHDGSCVIIRIVLWIVYV